MPRSTGPLLPILQRTLNEMGENIRLARLRRRIPASLIAERAGISRTTLTAIERGEPSVTLGAYARVLLSLGLEKDLTLLAKDDIVGRKLQDARLTIKMRSPRARKPAATGTQDEEIRTT